MELEEYLQDNNVTLWRNNRALGPQQTKSLADFDYAEGLENITGKMVWICDYGAHPTKALICLVDYEHIYNKTKKAERTKEIKKEINTKLKACSNKTERKMFYVEISCCG